MESNSQGDDEYQSEEVLTSICSARCITKRQVSVLNRRIDRFVPLAIVSHLSDKALLIDRMCWHAFKKRQGEKTKKERLLKPIWSHTKHQTWETDHLLHLFEELCVCVIWAWQRRITNGQDIWVGWGGCPDITRNKDDANGQCRAVSAVAHTEWPQALTVTPGSGRVDR